LSASFPPQQLTATEQILSAEQQIFTKPYAIECLKKILAGLNISKTDSNRLTQLLSREPDILSVVEKSDDVVFSNFLGPDFASV
jgi:hypothetical protein